MFSFLKKDPKKKLQKQYKALMEEAFRLSSTDRKASDAKTAEADKIAKQLEAMD